MMELRDRLVQALTARYEILELAGRGGMATVYRARDLRHQRDVAIKVLDRQVAALVGAERFLREVRIVAGLQHPHVVPVFDSGELPAVGQEPALPYFVMPFVAGESLHDRLARERTLPLVETVRVIRQIADALTHAHARGITHRDVKPDNILLADGNALLADFGIAQALEGGADSRLTQSGLVIGTPAYMSPEQGLGAPDVGSPADVYGLAAVAYEMITGEVPYPGTTPSAIRARQHSGPPRPASEVRSEIGADLDRVLARALAPDPARRFPTPVEFAAALEQAALAGRRSWQVRPPAGFLLLALLLLAVGIAVHRLRQGGESGRGSGVAVFPFRPMTESAGQWVETLPDLLATAIEGTPRFRVVDPWSLWSRLRATQGAQARMPDPAEADRLAAAARAGWFVLGTVGSSARTMQLILRVYQVGRSDPLGTVSVAGSPDSLAEVVTRAASGVIRALWTGRGAPERIEATDFTTRSPAALKAYLQAKEAMRRGLVDSADAAITESLRQDSTFGLALLEATRIQSWVTFMRGRSYRGLVALVDRARRYSDSLSERNRLRIEAAQASVNTEGRRGVTALRRILELDSTDIEAWEKLSYNQLVYGWQYGAGAADAAASQEHALALDSTYAPVLAMRAALSVRQADLADLARQERRLKAVDTTGSLIRGGLLSLRAVRDLGDSAAPWIDLAAREQLPVWIAVLRELRVGHPDAAMRLIQATRRAHNLQVSPDVLAGAELQLTLATGHFAALERGLSRPDLRDYPMLQQRALLMQVIASLSAVIDTAVAHRALVRLERMLASDLGRRGGRDSSATTTWAVAAWHAAYGDTATAGRWQQALRSVPPDPENPAEIDALRADLDARLAGRRQDIPESLMLARRAYGLWRFHENLGLDVSPEGATRFLLAVRLRQSGQSDSAAALFDSFIPPRTWVAGYTPRALLELAELAEERGDRGLAADYFTRALAFWGGGDAALADWIRRARDGLVRVTRERGGS